MGTRQGEWCAFGLDPDLPGDQREEDDCCVVLETEVKPERVSVRTSRSASGRQYFDCV